MANKKNKAKKSGSGTKQEINNNPNANSPNGSGHMGAMTSRL